MPSQFQPICFTKISGFQMEFRRRFAYQLVYCKQLGKILIYSQFVGYLWSSIRPSGSYYHQLNI